MVREGVVSFLITRGWKSHVSRFVGSVKHLVGTFAIKFLLVLTVGFK